MVPGSLSNGPYVFGVPWRMFGFWFTQHHLSHHSTWGVPIFFLEGVPRLTNCFENAKQLLWTINLNRPILFEWLWKKWQLFKSTDIEKKSIYFFLCLFVLYCWKCHARRNWNLVLDNLFLLHSRNAIFESVEFKLY
jgi:hypothetical protein